MQFNDSNLQQPPEKPKHFHGVLVNNGIEARLPAVAIKELALEVCVVFLGTRISATGAAELMSHGVTTKCAMGVLTIEECDCSEELLTQVRVKDTKNAEDFARAENA